MTDTAAHPTTNDPREWARSFLEALAANGDVLSEDELTVWFANALVTGAEQAEPKLGGAGRPENLHDEPSETWDEFWAPLFDADRDGNIEANTFRYDPAVERALEILDGPWTEPSAVIGEAVLALRAAIDFDQVQRELHDYSVALELVPNAYSELTGGALSKLNTDPKYVVQFNEDRHRLDLVEIAARAAHEVNRALQLDQGDPEPSPHWFKAPQWQRDAAIEGVNHVLADTTPEELHESWCAFKRADGWVYGDVKDGDAKTHPCLVPYDELPAGQKLKDATLLAVVLGVFDIATDE